MTDPLANISLRTFRMFLKNQGLKKTRTKGGHEAWSRNNLLRPVIIQSHTDPVPAFIIRNNLKVIGVSPSDFKKWLRGIN